MHAKQEKCNHETRCASVFSCTDSAIQFFPLYIFYFFKVLYKKGKCTENFEKISRCFHHAIIFGYSPFYTKDFCNIHQSTCRIVYVLASNRHYLAGRSRKQSTLSSSSRKQSTSSSNSRKQSTLFISSRTEGNWKSFKWLVCQGDSIWLKDFGIKRISKKGVEKHSRKEN